jgi:hypothetical protein
MSDEIERYRALLHAVVERDSGADHAAAARSQIEFAAECLARVATLWPDEWRVLQPEDQQ